MTYISQKLQFYSAHSNYKYSITLFPSRVNNIMVTLAPEPGGIWVETVTNRLPHHHEAIHTACQI